MNPALLTKPEEPKAKAPAKAKAKAAKRKVWSGAKKRISVSHLQLALPGIGGPAL